MTLSTAGTDAWNINLNVTLHHCWKQTHHYAGNGGEHNLGCGLTLLSGVTRNDTV